MGEVSTYYEVLEVTESASMAEIRSAYRKKAKQYHPDGVEKALAEFPWVKQEAEERFRQITEAWGVLGDPQKRRKYDEQLNAIRQSEQEEAAGEEEKNEDEEVEPVSTPYRPPTKGVHNVSQPPPPPPSSQTVGFSPAAPTRQRTGTHFSGIKIFSVALLVFVCLFLVYLSIFHRSTPPLPPPPPNSNAYFGNWKNISLGKNIKVIISGGPKKPIVHEIFPSNNIFWDDQDVGLEDVSWDGQALIGTAKISFISHGVHNTNTYTYRFILDGNANLQLNIHSHESNGADSDGSPQHFRKSH